MLKIISLGGAGDVTKNMFLYETEREILVVDCGAGFPEEEVETNNLTIPDFSYLRNVNKKIQGVVITHAHFDHYGALPYFLAEFKVPVFSSRLVNGFIKEKADAGRQGITLGTIDPGGSLALGDFKINSFLVNHSVPDAMGVVIEAGGEKIFQVADFKFDLTPVDGKIFDFTTCLRLAEGGVTALLSDCLGAIEPGFTQTESQIEENLVRIIKSAKGQVLVTTISSNISRIQQIIRAAKSLGREVVVLGRSLESSIKIANNLGYLRAASKMVTFFDDFKKRRKENERKILYLVAGSYGQITSALVNIAKDKYRKVHLKKGSVVVFSADPSPPNTREKVDELVDKLTLRGARVFYYELQENLHVSGHGSAEDLKLLMALVKPKIVIPIGGNPRHMRAYRFLAYQMKYKSEEVVEMMAGEIIAFSAGKVKQEGRVPLREILVEQE